MDPIHPILPQPPNIPPVKPAPSAGRVDRDGRRQRQPEDRYEDASGRDADGRRMPPSSPGAPPPAQQDSGDADERLHIDITV